MDGFELRRPMGERFLRRIKCSPADNTIGPPYQRTCHAAAAGNASSSKNDWAKIGRNGFVKQGSKRTLCTVTARLTPLNYNHIRAQRRGLSRV